MHDFKKFHRTPGNRNRQVQMNWWVPILLILPLTCSDYKVENGSRVVFLLYGMEKTSPRIVAKLIELYADNAVTV